MTDHADRLDYPATGRNREPILAALRAILPPAGTVLEIASGSGQHAAFFADALPGLTWQPSSPDPRERRSVAAWTAGMPNVLPPLDLDTTRSPWPIARADAVFCANMIHIAPWEAGLGLIRGAAAILPPAAPFILYGPFHRSGVPTAPGNAAFDEDLRARDPSWGVRNLEDVTQVAAEAGFAPPQVRPLPANNIIAVYLRG